jgi:DNA ligase-1
VTLLADVVRTSAQVGSTSSRLAKTAALAERLRSLEPDEIEIALPYLSGELRQGKLALGYRTLRPANPAATPTLTLRDVDAAFEAIKAAKGRGSGSQRAEMIDALFGRATAEEQDFLVRLIVGELRQGALEGVMLEALAAASGLPPALVRRAAMIGGGIAPVAAPALTRDRPGCALCDPPDAPDPADARPAGGDAAGRARGARRSRVRVEARRRARAGAQGGRRGARLYAQPERRHAAVPEVVAARRSGSDATDPRRRGDRLARRRPPHPFPVTMRRFGASGRRALRETLPLRCSSSTACTDGARSSIIRRASAARLEEVCRELVRRACHRDAEEASASIEDALRRARGRDGQGARRALRGGRRGAAG